MKTIIFTIVLLGATVLSYAQSKLENKWYSTAEVEFIFPNKFNYTYHKERGVSDGELEPDPIYSFEGELPQRLTMEGSFGIQF